MFYTVNIGVFMDKNIEFYYKSDSVNRKVLYSMSILWNKVTAGLDAALSEYNLNISKFNILMIIKHVGKEEGIQQNEISKRLLVTPSNITQLLDKLESDGMITRNSKPNDRRVKIIRTTDKASFVLDKVLPIYIHESDKLTASLTGEEIVSLEKLLEKWILQIK